MPPADLGHLGSQAPRFWRPPSHLRVVGAPVTLEVPFRWLIPLPSVSARRAPSGLRLLAYVPGRQPVQTTWRGTASLPSSLIGWLTEPLPGARLGGVRVLGSPCATVRILPAGKCKELLGSIRLKTSSMRCTTSMGRTSNSPLAFALGGDGANTADRRRQLARQAFPQARVLASTPRRPTACSVCLRFTRSAFAQSSPTGSPV